MSTKISQYTDSGDIYPGMDQIVSGLNRAYEDARKRAATAGLLTRWYWKKKANELLGRLDVAIIHQRYDQVQRAINTLGPLGESHYLQQWNQSANSIENAIADFENKKQDHNSIFLQLAFWKWDGKDVREILTKTKSTPIWEMFPEKKADWAVSVPEEWRGRIRGADTNLNAVNSEDYQINHVEILAMDNLGKALLLKVYSNNYTDADWLEPVIMSKDDALALCEEYRSSYTSQQALGRFDGMDQKPYAIPSAKLRG